jgi:hypothetical protein
MKVSTERGGTINLSFEDGHLLKALCYTMLAEYNISPKLCKYFLLLQSCSSQLFNLQQHTDSSPSNVHQTSTIRMDRERPTQEQ